MGRLFVARHGQTDYNSRGVLQGPRIDAELSGRGLQQAQALAHALGQRHLDVVFSSPMLRARQTAEQIAALQKERPVVQQVPELYEVDYGDLAGRPLDEVRPDLEQTLDAWRMGFADQPFPGGESARLAQHRMAPFVGRLRSLALERDVVVVGHGRINRILLVSLLGRGLDRLEEHPQSNANFSELQVTPEGIELLRLNDTSHLGLDDAADTVS